MVPGILAICQNELEDGVVCHVCVPSDISPVFLYSLETLPLLSFACEPIRFLRHQLYLGLVSSVIPQWHSNVEYPDMPRSFVPLDLCLRALIMLNDHSPLSKPTLLELSAS